jgi:hypothetical protein
MKSSHDDTAAERVKKQLYWVQRKDDLKSRKQELEQYFKSVEKLNNLPHSENAWQLWQEYTEHGNYPYDGGYYDQSVKWREDMVYVGAEVEYKTIDDDMTEANDELRTLGGIKT